MWFRDYDTIEVVIVFWLKGHVFGNSSLAAAIYRINQSSEAYECDRIRYPPVYWEIFLYWWQAGALWLRIHWPQQEN